MNMLLASKGFRISMLALGGLLLFLVGCSVGVTVGERRERHFENRNANFGEMFFPRPEMRMRGPLPVGRPQLPPAHGVFGKVVSVAWPSVAIAGPDATEQEIVATTSTEIRIGRDAGSPADVKPGVEVGVFGVPNASGAIEARLIRLSVPPENE